MLARLARLFRSLLGTSAIAISPLNAITGIVISLIIPYLLYTFLGGIGFAIALAGLGWTIWWFAKKKTR